MSSESRGMRLNDIVAAMQNDKEKAHIVAFGKLSKFKPGPEIGQKRAFCKDINMVKGRGTV
jgi:hypothetical protein